MSVLVFPSPGDGESSLTVKVVQWHILSDTHPSPLKAQAQSTKRCQHRKDTLLLQQEQEMNKVVVLSSKVIIEPLQDGSSRSSVGQLV
jgi:hypothetical protein